MKICIFYVDDMLTVKAALLVTQFTYWGEIEEGGTESELHSVPAAVADAAGRSGRTK